LLIGNTNRLEIKENTKRPKRKYKQHQLPREVAWIPGSGASFMPNAECEMRVERHVEVPKGEHFSVTYLGKSVAS